MSPTTTSREAPQVTQRCHPEERRAGGKGCRVSTAFEVACDDSTGQNRTRAAGESPAILREPKSRNSQPPSPNWTIQESYDHAETNHHRFRANTAPTARHHCPPAGSLVRRVDLARQPRDRPSVGQGLIRTDLEPRSEAGAQGPKQRSVLFPETRRRSGLHRPPCSYRRLSLRPPQRLTR